MARAKKPKIDRKQLQGFKLLEPMQHLVGCLHSVGTERDRAGNRELFYDNFLALLLLYFFNPVLTSLRSLQEATEIDKVQELVGGRFSLGSLSESANQVFRADALQEILRELAGQALAAIPHDDREATDALRDLVAVDGSLLPAVNRMAWALWMDEKNRAAKLHLQLDVFSGLPLDATITHGSANEKTEFRQLLTPGKLYVMDRGYGEYQLVQDIVDAGASVIVRLKDDACYQVQQEREITSEAAAVGVIKDVVIQRLGSTHRPCVIKQPLRIVIVQSDKLDKKGKPQIWTLITDRLDLPAEVIAYAYHKRWTIELFFRWIKQIMGCRHLLLESENGVALQVYGALIASLLLTLRLGMKPTKRIYELFCFFFMGMMDAAELSRHLARHGVK